MIDLAQGADRRLAPRRQHAAGVLNLGQVDRLLSLFHRIGHVAICGDYGSRRMDVEQRERSDFHTHPVRRNRVAQRTQAIGFNVGPILGENLIEHAGRDHLPRRSLRGGP